MSLHKRRGLDKVKSLKLIRKLQNFVKDVRLFRAVLEHRHKWIILLEEHLIPIEVQCQGNTKLVYMLSFVVIYEPINITVFVSSIMQLHGVNMGEWMTTEEDMKL